MQSLKKQLSIVTVAVCVLLLVFYTAMQRIVTFPVDTLGRLTVSPLYNCLQALVVSSDNDSFDPMVVGSVSLDIWRCRQYVGFTVDSMRIQKDWPLHPNSKSTSKELKHSFAKMPNYAFKMYGFLNISVNGDYKFQIVSHSTAALSLEFWLSNSSVPRFISKELQFTCPELVRNCSDHPESRSITLRNGSVYYFEFHLKAFDGNGTVELKWNSPGNKNYCSIPSENFGQPVEREQFRTVLAGPLPSNQLQGSSRVNYVTNTVYNITDLQVLPECTFKAEYASEKKVETYKGIYLVFQSKVYPKEPSASKREKDKPKNIAGNDVIPKTTIKRLVQMYTDAFTKSGKYKGKVLGARYVEETKNKDKGYRYLLEMDIQLEGKEDTIRTSEYVYTAKNNPNSLCHTSNFQWEKNVDVHVVVSVKNLGPWIRHLIQNMEEIYAATGDNNFQLIIVDYKSTDLDIEKELKNSSVPRWKVISKSGSFSRSQGLQAGIDYVQDDNSIVMTIDMHLTLPPNFIDAVRKHTIPGKMAYTPLFFRLDSGYTELNIVGSWETLTYGLFGMYKKDWKVSGGFDVKKYTNHWGGEDWDVLDKALRKGFEAFRLKPPGLVHYYHTKEGMWGSNSKGYGLC